MFNTVKLLNFMDIKKPQLVKVEAFVLFFGRVEDVLQHPLVVLSVGPVGITGPSSWVWRLSRC